MNGHAGVHGAQEPRGNGGATGNCGATGHVAGAPEDAGVNEARSAPRPDLLLATGGTGGHIYPALAVAHEARARGLHVMLLGQRRGMEERLAAEAAVPFLGVSAGKWNRQRPDPRHAWRALKGVIEAVRLVRKVRPHRVVGFGGFASFPGCVAAVLNGIPLILHEGNAFPSRVNRWFSSRAALVVSAQPEALAHLRGARETTVVPFPVREQRVDRAQARASLGLPEHAVVTLVMGGSQGSLTLNRAVPEAFRDLAHDASTGATPTDARSAHTESSVAESTDIGPGDAEGADAERADATPTAAAARRPVHHVLHAAGPALVHEVRERANDLANYHVVPYVDAPTAWSAADLAITRSGVGTLSEAALHGVPLVMVPLPTSAEDHQLHNARAVAAAGAGTVVEQRAIEHLAEAWRALLDPDARAAAAAAALARSPAGAARRMVDAVLRVGTDPSAPTKTQPVAGPRVQKRTPTP